MTIIYIPNMPQSWLIFVFMIDKMPTKNYRFIAVVLSAPEKPLINAHSAVILAPPYTISTSPTAHVFNNLFWLSTYILRLYCASNEFLDL